MVAYRDRVKGKFNYFLIIIYFCILNQILYYVTIIFLLFLIHNIQRYKIILVVESGKYSLTQFIFILNKGLMTNRQTFYLFLSNILFTKLMDYTMFSIYFLCVLRVFLVLFTTTLHDFPQFTTLRMDSLKCLYMDGANTL